jgi:Prokaryotic metallothionein
VEEQRETMGFLGTDGVLYCSQACARRHGQSAGCAVDQDEYDGLLGEDSLAVGTLCPGCGAEFPVEWPEREPS